MKSLLVPVAAFVCGTFAFGSNLTINLEDKALSPNGHYNGSDSAGGFTSQGAFFNNSYDTTYGSWGGFAYSNVTDNVTAGFGNQYSAWPGSGAGGSNNYAIGYYDTFTPAIPTILLPAGNHAPQSIDIANTTYAALTIRDGDPNGFSKKFGGDSGDDPDWFLLTIQGFNDSNVLTGSIDFYLADYRFASTAQDYIVNGWQTVNLSSLGTDVAKLAFAVSSSDAGVFGINTPAYFAVDNVVVAPEPSALLLWSSGACVIWLLRRRLTFRS